MNTALIIHALKMHIANIKEELSYAYIHAVASRVGFGCDRPRVDADSIDVVISAHGKVAADSILHSARLDLQLKATAVELAMNGSGEYSFELPIKNYNDLKRDTLIPRLLVLFAMPTDEEKWLSHDDESLITRKCAYWCNLFGLPDVTNAASKTVHVPKKNVFSPAVLAELMRKISRREVIGLEL
jgi:hypothetical protein